MPTEISAIEEKARYYGYTEEYLDSILFQTLEDTTLNPNHRECLYATYFGGESQAEIAMRLKYANAGSVKVRVCNFLKGPFTEAFKHKLAANPSPVFAA